MIKNVFECDFCKKQSVLSSERTSGRRYYSNVPQGWMWMTFRPSRTRAKIACKKCKEKVLAALKKI